MTLEQCKKLKDWGLSQIVKSGTSYWNKHIGRPQWLAAGIADWEIDNEHSFAIPDLEQLWDEAEKMLRNYRGTGNFSHIDIKRISPNPKDGYVAVEIYQPLPNYTFAGKDKDRKVAIYKLLEKIMSPAVLSPPKRG